MNKMPKQNLDSMGLRDIKTGILQSASFPSGRKYIIDIIEHEPSI